MNLLAVLKGDLPGHEFHGNQWNTGDVIYHGTTPDAAKAIAKSGFDLSKTADGSIWFTSNPKIGDVAASGSGAIIKRSLTEGLKLGSWDESDKYSTDELIAKGYDGLILPDTGETTYQIFNPHKLGIVTAKADPMPSQSMTHPETDFSAILGTKKKKVPPVGQQDGTEQQPKVDNLPLDTTAMVAGSPVNQASF